MIKDRTLQPVLKAISELPAFEVQRTLLDNEIPVQYLKVGSQELLKMQISIPAGIIHQNQALLAFFTNKMLKEGSKNYTATQIAEKLDFFGAFLETKISRDQAYITLFCLHKYLDQILPVLADLLTQPIFSPKELEILVAQEKQSFQVRMEKLKTVAQRAFTNQIFGAEHPYGKYAELADYDLLESSALHAFFHEHYHTSNWKIYLTGYVQDETIATINRYLGSIPSSKTAQKSSTIPGISSQISTPNIHWVTKTGALQTALKMGKTIINRRHEDFPALSLTQTILGGYFGSRLMRNIREDKGYTYGIYANIQHFEHSSFFNISTEVGTKVTQQSITEIQLELQRLRNEKIREEELQLVKNYMAGSLLRSLNGPFALAEMMKIIEEQKLSPQYYSDFIQSIHKINSEQVMETAQNYLTEDSMHLVLVGEKQEQN